METTPDFCTEACLDKGPVCLQSRCRIHHLEPSERMQSVAWVLAQYVCKITDKCTKEERRLSQYLRYKLHVVQLCSRTEECATFRVLSVESAGPNQILKQSRSQKEALTGLLGWRWGGAANKDSALCGDVNMLNDVTSAGCTPDIFAKTLERSPLTSEGYKSVSSHSLTFPPASD